MTVEEYIEQEQEHFRNMKDKKVDTEKAPQKRKNEEVDVD